MAHLTMLKELGQKKTDHTVPLLSSARPGSLPSVCSPWLGSPWPSGVTPSDLAATVSAAFLLQVLVLLLGLCKLLSSPWASAWVFADITLGTSWNKNESDFQAPCNLFFSCRSKAILLCKTRWLFYRALHCGWHLLLRCWQFIRDGGAFSMSLTCTFL